METSTNLKITDEAARLLYPKADPFQKAILEASFGEDFFSQKVTDKIKTWEDAAKAKGLNPVSSLPYPDASTNREKGVNAFFQLDIIAELLRDGVELDWANGDQRKWYPYFNEYSSGSGFRFYDTDFGWTDTDATGGARLCVDTQEKAKYMGTQFLSIYNHFLNPIQ